MSNIYNSFIISGIFLVLVLAARSLANNIVAVDQYLSNLSPYVEVGAGARLRSSSGIRGRIPKPIFVQACRDLVPLVGMVGEEVTIFLAELSEELVGTSMVAKPIRPVVTDQPKPPIISKPKGCSLLFVNSFCKEVFRADTRLEECRMDLQDQCGLDLLQWFNSYPDTNKVRRCLVAKFRKGEDFFQNFTSRIAEREHVAPSVSAERAPLSRVRLLLAWIAGCMLGLLALRQVRTKLLHQSEYFQLQLRQQEVLQQISARTCHLQDTDWDVYQDTSTSCYDFNTEVGAGSHELYGYCSLIVLDPRPEQQVYLVEEDSGVLEKDEAPVLEYLDISWEKNMMEESRVGITTIHQADFDIDIDGDAEGANDDNIFVTGFEQDASDPLRLNYWRRRLRDVRDLLSQAALDKLKQKCPTLFNMGWFKDMESSRKSSVIESSPADAPGTQSIDDVTNTAEELRGESAALTSVEESVESETLAQGMTDVKCADCEVLPVNRTMVDQATDPRRDSS